MNLDEQFLEMTDKIRLIKLENENVIRFPNQNTLNTKVKQIKNPQKEISGGFFYGLGHQLPRYNKVGLYSCEDPLTALSVHALILILCLQQDGPQGFLSITI